MQLDKMICEGSLAVINDLYEQFQVKYQWAEIDYDKVVTSLKNMSKDFVNGSYTNKDFPTSDQIDSTIIDLIKLAQAYETNGINFGALGQLGISAAMAGIEFDLATGKVTQGPEWLVKALLDNIDNVICTKLGQIPGQQVVDLINAIEKLENDLIITQLQTITLQSSILEQQCPFLSGYPKQSDLVKMLGDVGLDDTLTISLQKITDKLFPIVNGISTNYFDSSFLKKMEGMKLAYRISRNMILGCLKKNPISYWSAERLKQANAFGALPD